MDLQAWFQWCVATLIAGVAMGTMIHGCVFTRPEAQSLVERMDRIEIRLDKIDGHLLELIRHVKY